MNPLVANYQASIAALCRRYRVARLDLFGSAVSGGFDDQRSDFDFIAEFIDPAPTVDYADRVIDFAASLEEMLGRNVDVVSASALSGSRLERAIAGTRQLVYAESDAVAV